MRCDGCKNWVVKRVTRYADGSEIVNWESPAGKGRCGVLDIDTTAEFGCTSFAAGEDHVDDATWMNGSPWQHWIMVPCPDCGGDPSRGGGVCNRCAGTSNVRRYDDGFVGDEQTRMHPKEKATAPALTCRKCSATVDVKWIACPHCGTKLEPPAKTEVIDDALANLPPAKETGR